jgi:hypothetical protein
MQHNVTILSCNLRNIMLVLISSAYQDNEFREQNYLAILRLQQFQEGINLIHELRRRRFKGGRESSSGS